MIKAIVQSRPLVIDQIQSMILERLGIDTVDYPFCGFLIRLILKLSNSLSKLLYNQDLLILNTFGQLFLKIPRLLQPTRSKCLCPGTHLCPCCQGTLLNFKHMYLHKSFKYEITVYFCPAPKSLKNIINPNME